MKTAFRRSVRYMKNRLISHLQLGRDLIQSKRAPGDTNKTFAGISEAIICYIAYYDYSIKNQEL